MNKLRDSIMIGSVLAASQAIAVNGTTQTPTYHRQLVGCMTKQMAASRTISYNEATKLCKDQIKYSLDSGLALNEPKSANVRTQD